jgi:anti-sigma regulatory factor (Ser/Thr protein kinase)
VSHGSCSVSPASTSRPQTPMLVSGRSRDWLHKLRYPEEKTTDIVLALVEAVSNACEHMPIPQEILGEPTAW